MTKHWTVLVTASLATLLALFAPAPVARADIFQWEYINPANPSLGKQQSATLCPDGVGVEAAPGADLPHRNLTMAYLINVDFSPYPIYDEESNLIGYITAALNGTNLSQADLTNANFSGAELTGAIVTDTEVRGAVFSSTFTSAQLYSTLSYQNHDLSRIQFVGMSLVDWNFAGQNLTNAKFTTSALTGANFTGAEVRGASFREDIYNPGAGITLAQLYSTASYQAHDLTGLDLRFNNLAGVNLAGQNLTNVDFQLATLSGANLTGAEVRNADFTSTGISLAQLYSTASYLAHDLTGINLTGAHLEGVNLAGQNLTKARLSTPWLNNANLSQANLTNAYFWEANLEGANLTGAEVRGANFSFLNVYSYSSSHFTAAQLYSTASYQDHDLSGILLHYNNLAGWNFAGQNLTNAGFYAATLTSANLSGADARGANFENANPFGANTNNLIQSNGHIAGLNLTAGASLVVRDYDGNPVAYPTPTGPLPIVVEQHLAMNATGTLRLVFDADAWDSTISFAPGIPVALGGTLDLTFAPGVNVATQSGRTIDLFDWTGVTPTGAFTISSPYTWNLTHLYTTGEITLTAVPSLPGDFNRDGTVDGADYVVWRKNPGGIYTQNDFDLWRAHFGRALGSASSVGASENVTVPEPTTFILMILAAIGWCLHRRHAHKKSGQLIDT